MPCIRLWNYNRHNYGLNVLNLNWNQARSSALEAGWYLVEINDSSENIFIDGILSDYLPVLASDEEFNCQDNSLDFLNHHIIASDDG